MVLDSHLLYSFVVSDCTAQMFANLAKENILKAIKEFN